MTCPIDASGQPVRLSEFEFPDYLSREDKLDDVERDAYQTAVAWLETPEGLSDDDRCGLYDRDAARVRKEFAAFYADRL